MFVYPLTRTLSRPSLSRIVDDTFDRFFVNAAVPRTVRTPALDVSETDAGYVLALDVPGVARDQLKVSIEGRRVTIETTELPAPVAAEADAAKAEAPAEPRPLYRERGVARYARTVSLPAEVDQGASQARFENGVLTLTLAKKVKTGATQLAIG